MSLIQRNTVQKISAKKSRGEKITMLTPARCSVDGQLCYTCIENEKLGGFNYD